MLMVMVPARETVLIITRAGSARSAMEKAFREFGYEVEEAESDQGAFEAWSQQSPSVIIADRQACQIDRLRVHKPFRKVPIIALGDAGSICSEEDCLVEFDHGADLVVCNQSMRELVARVRAILRRKDFERSPSVHCVAGAIQMDLDRHEVRVNGMLISLTPKEFQILRHFMESPNRVFSRQDMLNRVWGEGYALEEHALDVHIHSLRQKVEEDPAKPKSIVTVRGVGYKFKVSG